MPAPAAKKKSKTNHFTLSRLYDAPVQAVWDAWTDPEQVAQWWGPRGFTITTHSKDLRPGGTWDYTMHGPDGTDYPNTTHYLEVREREALVYDHGSHRDRPPLFRVAVTFKEAAHNKTALELTMTLASPEAVDEILQHIKQAGGNSTWDRLAEYLAHDEDIFVINRSFDVPLQQMFAMWTQPEHFVQWLPPTGMKMECLSGEIQPGAALFARMYCPEFDYHFRFTYSEVTPQRIVYTQQFCDAQGQVTRHPMAPTWPGTMLTTVLLTPEGPATTRVTVTMRAHGPATSEERQAFTSARTGMTQGWTGSFDKLEDSSAEPAER